MCVVAIDATVLAGTTAPVNMRKQGRVAEWAGRKGLPLIFLSDNDGGRIPDLLGWRFSERPVRLHVVPAVARRLAGRRRG